MEYRILGPVEVGAGGEPLYLGGPREHRGMVALLLAANRVVAIDRLIHVLWGESPPRTAATQIRNTMSTLRRHLAAAADGTAPISRSGAGFVVRVFDGELDFQVFRRHMDRARTLAEQGDLSAAAAELRAGLDLWRGPALGGLGAPVLDAEAIGLEEQRAGCLERRIELDLALGRHRDLVGELATLVDAYPLRERFAELQMIVLLRSGRRQDALAAFAAARARLAHHAGLDPRPELVRLQQAILRGDASLNPAPAAEPGRREGLEAGGPPVPAQLPSDVAAFTGRRILSRSSTTC